MKPAKATWALVVILAGIMASEPVLAKGGRGGGRGGAHSGSRSHGHPATHARTVIVGSAVFWPGYYYPPYAALSAAPPAPWGYIEQGTDSYFCAESQSSYPDAQECAGPWQLITPVPAPGS